MKEIGEVEKIGEIFYYTEIHGGYTEIHGDFLFFVENWVVELNNLR